MRFDLIDLRLFLNVHLAGTITGGAHASYMTLASASERIRGMEDALGVPLLIRDRRGVQLTPAGRALLHHARLVLRQMDRLHGEMGEYGKGLKGHVRLLSNTSALSEHLPELLSTFLAGHPGLSVDLEEKPSDEIVDAIRNDMYDLGVVSDAANLEGLEIFPFREDPLVLVVPRDHALAACPSIRLAETMNCDFVGLIEGSALQEHVGHHARRQGMRLNYRVRLRSFESICRVVGLGIGVAVVPQAAAIRYARSARIKRVRLADAWARRNLVVCVRDLNELPVHERHLLEHLLSAGRHPF
jgi:DNA-binding transcriptional LysR family regulator